MFNERHTSLSLNTTGEIKDTIAKQKLYEEKISNLHNNHLSTYAEKLAKINPILINQLTFHILPSDHRPVTITFTTNNDSDNDSKLSLYQKCRIQYEN